VIAHNAEAALVALAARRITGVPVIYVAHTILGYELSAYGPAQWSRGLDRLGRGIDRSLARNADAVIALCREAESALSGAARGPLCVIPPGLEARPAPAPETQEQVCAEHGLHSGAFALYAGNLDGYQDLDLLADAAARLPESMGPVIVATHDAGRPGRNPPKWQSLRFIETQRYDQIRALSFAAHSLVVTRRRPGGFPVKLLNYMETGRPIVGFSQVAAGLEHDHSAWLLPAGAGARELAEALQTLRGDPERAERLGASAREHLRSRHAWPALAGETLDLIDRVLETKADERASAAR